MTPTLKANHPRETGYTLVELLTVVAISGILLGSLAGLIKIHQDQFRSNQAVWTGEQSVYFGMELLVRELREARNIIEAQCNAAQICFIDFNNQTLIYRLNDGKLERQAGDGSVALVASVLTTGSAAGASCFTLLEQPVVEIAIRLQGRVGGRVVTVENTVTPRNL